MKMFKDLVLAQSLYYIKKRMKIIVMTDSMDVKYGLR